MKNEVRVAGIRCGEVLARLQDYLDHEVDAETGRRIEAHLRGCDRCARFGGRYADLVSTLRQALLADVSVAPPEAWRSSLRTKLP